MLLNYWLAPDMLPFIRQIQIAADLAKGAAARLADMEVPKHDDTEKTYAHLKARIANTVAFVESIQPNDIDGEVGHPNPWRTHDEFQRPALSSAFCDAQLLLPLHHRLRHSAALWC